MRARIGSSNFSRFDIGGVENRTGGAGRVRLHRARHLPARRRNAHRRHREAARLAAASSTACRSRRRSSMRAVARCRRANSRCPRWASRSRATRPPTNRPPAPTRISVYLMRNGKRGPLLGSDLGAREGVPARPDEDRVAALERSAARLGCAGRMCRPRSRCAISTARPRSDRRIKSASRALARAFSFRGISRATQFYDPLRDGEEEQSSANGRSRRADDEREGAANFDLQLERFADATYAMSVLRRRFRSRTAAAASRPRNSRSSLRCLTSSATKRTATLDYIHDEHAARDRIDRGRSAAERSRVENLSAGSSSRNYVSVLDASRRTATMPTNPCCRSGRAHGDGQHRRGWIELSRFRLMCPAITCSNCATTRTPPAEQSSLHRRRPRRGLAFAGEERGVAGEAVDAPVQHRRRDRDQRHGAVHGQRPDHDRARQGLCARLVQGGHARAACSTSACRKVSKARGYVNVCLRPRARFEGRSS